MTSFADQFAAAEPAFTGTFGEAWTFPTGAVTCLFEQREQAPELDATGRVSRQTATLSWPVAAGVDAPKVDTVLTRVADGETWAVATPPLAEEGWVVCDLVRRRRVSTGGL